VGIAVSAFAGEGYVVCMLITPDTKASTKRYNISSESKYVETAAGLQ
jgi:hypothetical protein